MGVRSLGLEYFLEEGMATHSSILAWRISWTEDPGGLQSMGLQRVRHNLAAEHTHTLLQSLSSFSLSFSQWPCHLQIQRWNKIGTVSYFYHQFHHLTCVCTHPQCLFSVHNIPAILSFLYWGHVQFHFHIKYFSSVQSLSSFQLFAIPWTAACQVSLSITNSQSLLKLLSIKSVMPYNHLILFYPLYLLPSIFPSIRVFSNESALPIRWPKYWRVWASVSGLPMNTQDWSPLGWTGWISLKSKGLSRVFSNTTAQKHQFCAQRSLWSNSHIHTWPQGKP